MSNIVINTDGMQWDNLKIRDFAKQRHAAYVGNALRSDMTFYIEDEEIEIPGHKLLVGAGSPTLEKIIFGSGHIAGTNQMHVRNISSVDFLEVIRYIYTDLAMLTTSNAVAIMKTAHYYELHYLEKQCVDLLTSMLAVNNVCSIYESVIPLQNQLTTNCIDMMLTTMRHLLKNGTFMAMRDDSVVEVLSKDAEINVEGEWQIYESMYNDAVRRLKTVECEINATNLRCALDGRLHLIRFPTMSSAGFTKCLALNDEILSNDEISNISKYIAIGKRRNLTFSTKPRRINTSTSGRKFNLYEAESYTSEEDW